MIRNLTQTFAAGEIKTFEISGNYIEILSCSNPIDIFLEDRNGVPVSRMEKASASYYIKIQDQQQNFARVMIKSDTAQTVSIVLADGEAGTRTMSGVVRVQNDFEQNALAQTGFLASSADSLGVGAAGNNFQGFCQVALINQSAKSLVIQKIKTYSRFVGIVPSIHIDGAVTMRIEAANLTRFNNALANSNNNLSVLGLPIRKTLSKTVVNDTGGAAATTLFDMPEEVTGINLDLAECPIILGPNKMLVVTKYDLPIDATEPIRFSALFMGQIANNESIPVT